VGRAEFRSPSDFYSVEDDQAQTAYFDSSNRISGTALDGVYQTTITIPRASDGGTWKLRFVYGTDSARNNSAYSSTPDTYNSAYPAGTPVDLVVTSPHPITINHPEIYNYKGYVKNVSTYPPGFPPFGLSVGDSFSATLTLFYYTIGSTFVTGGAYGGVGGYGFYSANRSPELGYTTIYPSDGSSTASVSIDASEGYSDFSFDCGTGYTGFDLSVTDPSGRAANASDIFSSLRSGDWPVSSGTFAPSACETGGENVTVNVRGSFPLETELLKVQSKTPPPSGVSPAQWSGVFSSSAASNRAGTYFNANAPAQFITYTVSVLHRGTYRVLVGVQTKPNKGKFQLAIDGVNQGSVQDQYAATAGYTFRDLGTVVFTTTGNKAFTFTVAGRNASSTGYTLAFDYVHLVPTLRQETESLKVQSMTPIPSGYTSAQWFGKFNASGASGGAGTYLNATAQGNYITYTVPVVKAGMYHVRVGIQTKPDKGIFQLAINGLNVGQPQDEYYPSITYAVRDLGPVSFSVAGSYAFKFAVTGKNASSTGYTLAFDYIDLLPVQ